VTALIRLLRTTAFKLSVIYLSLFIVVAFLLVGYLGWNARRIVDNEVASTIDAEVRGLSEQYNQGGIRRLVTVIEQRSRQPGASLYLVATFSGERLAGNVSNLPPGVLDRPGGLEIEYQRNDDAGPAIRRAIVRVFVLPGQFRVLVGRDLEDRQRFRHVMNRAFGLSLVWIIVLGGLGGLVMAWRVLRRVDGMTATTQRIMAGNLAERLPVAGKNDELDRLALNLNAMLGRIEELMSGMQQVSDNIAHDLKTPLTRMRNRAEEALRQTRTADDYRAALDGVIEEADGLIRIFNALLTIARLEAGNTKLERSRFDAAQVLHDTIELYEPLAEDAGLTLCIDCDETQDMTIIASRELIGQAIANLIDNALKYGVPSADQPQDMHVVTASLQALPDRIEMTVADHGSGIAPQDRARVLERFTRLETSRTKPGFGLGLSLVAAVMHIHGGSLRLEDNAPGLKVILTLPKDGT
jgi:signal transduction histidine kinase